MAAIEKDLKILYRKELQEHTAYTGVFASLFVIIIYVFFLWLDRIIFPEICDQLLPLRLLPLLLSILYMLSYFLYFKKHPRLGYVCFAVLLVALQISVNSMVFISFTVDLDATRGLGVIGSLTPLFIGTYLAADGLRRYLWLILSVPHMILLLSLVFILKASPQDISYFANPATMLVLAIIMGFLENKLRFREFRTRKLVETQREQLLEGEKTLKALLEESTKINQELLNTKDKLVQSEKLAAIGQLAAGVAHEINNPLAFATSNLDVLQQYLNAYQKLLTEQKTLERDIGKGKNITLEIYRDRLQTVLDKNQFNLIEEDTEILLKETMTGLMRIANITKELTTYARTSGSKPSFYDVREIIETVLKIIPKKLSEKIKIETHYKDIPQIMCDEQALGQVFTNLIMNAIQAMDKKEGMIEIHVHTDNDNVVIEIKDNGQGIAEKHIHHIFDPFYTTKPVGQGTGLGLSISYNIIQQHKGSIEVRSTVNKGTCFSVILPQIKSQNL